MSRTMKESVQAFAVKQILHYLDEDPDKSLPKILDWAEKFDKDGRNAHLLKPFHTILDNPDNNWNRITVNNLCPGVFYTDRNKDCLADPVYGPKVTAAIPMHDYAMPEDAAGTALLLASDAGRYITGATIMIDGGLSIPG